MSKREEALVVDGSNAVHALFGPFQADREADRWEGELLRLVARWAEPKPGAHAEVVFDGGWRAVASSGVRVLFSESGPADTLIIERARAHRHYRRKVTVVTYDAALAQAARAEEARVIGPDALR